ncbi:MAG: hypothetical protein IIY16_03825, partial [Oscillospiraceae bacterium]|nr:hypothetical protein [Oscillospiraceae bacterium]
MLRRLPAMFLILALLAGLFSGCTTEPLEPDPALSETVESDEIIEIEIDLPEDETVEVSNRLSDVGIAWQSTESLHPYTTQSITNQMIISLLYESLFVVSSSFEAQPLLCKAFSVSEDSKVWHFELRNDIVFSDGTPITADDVVASLNAAQNSALYKTRFDVVSSIRADGTDAFIVWLKTACENLPLLLDIPIVKGSTVSCDIPTGSGPYVCSGEALVQNQNWWQDIEPKVDAQVIDFVEANDAQSVRNAFEFGGADLSYTDPCATSVADY